jgi:colicin import membrane protein
MSNSLQSKIQNLTSSFATSLMEIVLSSPLEEIVGTRAGGTKSEAVAPAEKAPKKGKKGRLPRRSEADIAEVVGRIVKLLAGKPKGLRAEDLREELGVEAKELPRPLADAIASKLITKEGDKRATTYFAKGAKKTAAKSATKAPKAKKKASTKAKAAPKKAKSAKKAAPKAKKAAKKAAKKLSEAAETNGEV